jgi:drug/metabolite transporter (DMT)-like permease
MTARTDRRALLAAGVLIVMWSSGFIGAELGTRQAPASTLLAWRYLVAALVLVAVCLWRREVLTRAIVRRQVVLGLLLQAGYLGLTVTGVGLGVSAGTSSLIAAIQPLVVVAIATVALSEPARIAQLVGLAVGLAGVVLVVSGDLGAGGTPWWTYAMPFAGMLSLAWGTVLQQRWRPPESLVLSLAVQSVTAGVVFWVVALVGGTAAAPTAPAFWGAVAWVVVLSSFGGYGSYIYVTRTQGASRASTLLYLTPPTTMLWAALMFGDTVHPLGLAGLAVCAVGVAVALRRPSGERLAEVDAVR